MRFLSSRSLRGSLEVQRAACSQACGAGAFVRGIGSRPAPRCNARVTDYLRHTTLPAAHCRYTQVSGRATCSPDPRSIDRSNEIGDSWKDVREERSPFIYAMLTALIFASDKRRPKTLKIIFIFLYNTNILELIYLHIVTREY